VAWELHGDKLHPVPTDVTPGRLWLVTLAGAPWVLRDWSWDEPVAPGIEITLDVGWDLEGVYRFGGHAACNRYSVKAAPGDTPGDVAIGNPIATKMACPDPQMAAESRFLRRLASVRKYSFVATQLALDFRDGDTTGTMLFERTKP